MKSTTALAILFFLGANPGHPFDEEIRVDGTICRMNRSVDRMIVATDDGSRVRVVVPESAAVTIESAQADREDVRPGAPVVITGVRSETHVEASTVDVQIRVADVLFDVLMGPRKTLTGRFGVREAQTEYFQFRLDDGTYIRVDAKAAYGPKGRAWVKSFRSGDLLELGGDWAKPAEFRASYIRNITDDEPVSCSSQARRDETKQQTAQREAAERRFLDGYDEEPEN